jgi:hypothetical protein
LQRERSPGSNQSKPKQSQRANRLFDGCGFLARRVRAKQFLSGPAKLPPANTSAGLLNCDRLLSWKTNTSKGKFR